ncbi:CobW family GTP-binding protein [Synechococcus elongatus]|uniref:GTP-binding protein n=1 Tax=Synechococcus elongatus PCC 11802 TaxID=2283154 RepID=A0AAU6R5K2_SYNEL|nr:GTP-binding protein [Synechococcus elongatus]QFZ92998.1 GTP-binding protein [Synechococcus elongatus PCC 11802]
MFRATNFSELIIPDFPKQGLPVTLITGFLGSGKTTLLQKLLLNAKGQKIAAIVNDFGSLNIDHQLLVSVDEDVLELGNGCLCCTANESLVETVYEILERPERVDYLVIETTGIADPIPLLLTFLGTELKLLTRLDAILTLVDSSSFDVTHYRSQAALNQIQYADQILLTKTDLIDAKKCKEVEDAIRSIKDRIRIHDCSFGDIPLSLILDLELTPKRESHEIQELKILASQQLFADNFMVFPFQSQRPFNLKKFEYFLNFDLPESICRAKGLLYFQDQPETYIFQLSGQRFSVDRFPSKRLLGNQLVLIGRQFNSLELIQKLNNCLA